MLAFDHNTKIFVALSGGVDSAVAACLLLEKGYAVTGMFMKNWSGEDYGVRTDCPWEKDQEDAEQVCNVLGIPFRSVNFEKEYRESVIKYFFSEYSKGRTPNPDVICNKSIKFKVFLEKAMELGGDMIATGHYAIIEKHQKFQLHKGIDEEKDQSYFLHRLDQSQLSKTLFPLGNYTKGEVREMARKYNLPVAEKKDSQGICFIGKINVSEFLRENIPSKTGDIIDIDTTKVVGTHDGIMFYTIGQRHGMGIGGTKKPYFVVSKDIDKNRLYVALGGDHPLLFKKEIFFSNPHFICGEIPKEEELSASIRYRHKPQLGRLNIGKNTFVFNEPQKAPSPGQSIVFYDGSQCLGGAIIEQSS